jgi:putative transposase
MLCVVQDEAARAEGQSMLDEICREGARKMLAAALEAEVDAYLAGARDERDENGHALVTRNGHARPRSVQTVAGAVAIRAPRVNDRRVDEETGEKAKFKSSIIPPWCRRSPKVAEVLPLLYLHGLSTGDFAPALEGFFGSAAGLSSSVITRLVKSWQDEHRAFMEQPPDRDEVYVWVDGVHFNVRPGGPSVLSRRRGRAPGWQQSSSRSWTATGRRPTPPRRCFVTCATGACEPPSSRSGTAPSGSGRRSGTSSPRRRKRCWVHEVANILDALPKSIQPLAKRMLTEVRDAEDREHARRAAKAFDAEFRPKWPKAADKLSDDLGVLLRFYDYPAEHWTHLKTSNPIESTFSTVRLRTRVTKGPGSRAAGLAMAFKLIESAEDHWRYVNGAHLVALVRAGATFRKGVLVESEVKVEQEGEVAA